MTQIRPTVKSIFDAALEIENRAERSAYLQAKCGDDRELRAKVDALLAAYENAESFLESPPPAFAATITERPLTERPGDTVGPYKLLEQIGEGGFGVVFMAEQTAPVKRKVALKVLKPGMDTRQVIARFEAERQALALMDHPNIARVLDAGATATGRPFFVMELVRGVPITEYCDQSHLTPRERLELFVTVCQAVQHAHQKGIIHRDIKPTNILVTQHDDKPVVKVIDFGIAKATSGQLTDKTLFTGFAQMIGTPLYMSPEQAAMSGLDVDTRSDIYSLGVLLYELLTGTTPFDKTRLQRAAFDEVRRIIREEEPQKPSTRLSSLGETLPSISAQRKTEPHKLSRLVRGDLDWIVMKALEKDRVRRYETANGFAADVLRYLADEPVTACPPSAVYRVRKFARRNKVGLAAAATVLVFLVLLGGGFGWTVRDRQAREAAVKRERAARQAALEHEATRALDEVETWYARENWPEAMAATRRAAGLLAAGEAAPELPRRVQQWRTDLDTVNRLEELLIPGGGETQWEWSVTGDAEYEREFKVQGIDVDGVTPEVAAEQVRTRRIRGQLISALESWAQYRRNIMLEAAQRGLDRPAGWWSRPMVVARLADPDEFRSQIRQALEQENSDALLPLLEAPQTASLPATTVGWMARVVYWSDQGQHREQAFRLLMQAQTARPDDWSLNSQLANYLNQVNPNWPEAAVPYLRVALALRPQQIRTRLRLAYVLRRIDRLDEASAEFNEVLRLSPDNADARNGLGLVLADRKMWDDAVEQYRRAIARNANVSAYHANLSWALLHRQQLDEAFASGRRAIEIDPNNAVAHDILGHVLKEQQNLAGAEVECRRALELDPSDANTHNSLGVLLKERQKLTEAETEYRRAIELNRHRAGYFVNLGAVLNDQHRQSEAETAYMHAIELDPNLAVAWNNLGNLFFNQHKIEQAEEAYRRAIVLDPGYPLAHNNLGNLLRDRRQFADAERAYRQAIDLDPEYAIAYSNLGNSLYDQHRLNEAESAYRRATELDPEYAIAYINLGNALNDQHKPGEAEAACGRAIELDPNAALAHNNLGCALWAQHKPIEAETAFRRAIELDPDLASAHNGLGNALWDQDRTDEADAAYHRAIELNPELADAYVGLANVLKKHKHLGEAEAAFRRAIELKPDLAVAHHGLGSALEEQDRLAEAEAEFRRTIELDPDLAIAHEGLGIALKGQNRWEDAEAAYRRAIELDPTNASAYNNLGILLDERGNSDAAEAALHRAIELKPTDPIFQRNLGVLLQLHNRLEEAVACFRSMADAHPDDASAHLNLGNVLKDQRQLEAAETSYRRALELAPNNARVHYGLGNVFYDRKELDKAAAYYRRAIELDPAFAWPHNNLGTVLRDQNKLSEAEACYRRALELDPAYAYAWRNLGIVLAGQQRVAEAEGCYRHAIELDPTDTDTHINLGFVLAVQNRLADAAAAFRRATELNPNSTVAHYNLGFTLRKLKKLPEATGEFRCAVELAPDVKYIRGQLAETLVMQGDDAAAVEVWRDALRRSPADSEFKNNLAWLLATSSAAEVRHPGEAVALARETVAQAPGEGNFWNTLGIAEYAADHWQEAVDSLSRSNELLQGEQLGFNAFFLAMAQWQLGHKDEARDWYNKGAAWMAATAPENEELVRFRTEAAALLGITEPPAPVGDSPDTKPGPPTTDR